MAASKLYRVVIAVPRKIQQSLHKEQASRQLAGKKQTVAQIASEWLTIKATEAQPVE